MTKLQLKIVRAWFLDCVSFPIFSMLLNNVKINETIQWHSNIYAYHTQGKQTTKS